MNLGISKSLLDVGCFDFINFVFGDENEVFMCLKYFGSFFFR